MSRDFFFRIAVEDLVPGQGDVDVLSIGGAKRDVPLPACRMDERNPVLPSLFPDRFDQRSDFSDALDPRLSLRHADPKGLVEVLLRDRFDEPRSEGEVQAENVDV